MRTPVLTRLAAGDLDGDGFKDIAVANSGSANSVFLNRPSGTRPANEVAGVGAKHNPGKSVTGEATSIPKADQQFQGTGGRRIADGPLRTKWNAVGDKTEGVLWSVDVPGLAHSSPVIAGDRVYLATAIASAGDAPLKVGRGGRPDAANDDGEQSWVVLCYDKNTGEEIWRKTARKGKPRATRHVKATHANTSVCDRREQPRRVLWF